MSCDLSMINNFHQLFDWCQIQFILENQDQSWILSLYFSEYWSGVLATCKGDLLILWVFLVWSVMDSRLMDYFSLVWFHEVIILFGALTVPSLALESFWLHPTGLPWLPCFLACQHVLSCTFPARDLKSATYLSRRFLLVGNVFGNPSLSAKNTCEWVIFTFDPFQSTELGNIVFLKIKNTSKCIWIFPIRVEYYTVFTLTL